MFHDEVAQGRGGEQQLRHATEDAKSDDKGRGGEEGRCSRTDTAVDECKNGMVDRVARYRFDK